MMYSLIKEMTELLLIAGSLYLLLRLYLHYQPAGLTVALIKRRISVLLLLILAASIIKISEAVYGGESGPSERLLLLYMHAVVPTALMGMFETITLSGSFMFLFPVATIITMVLLYTKWHAEALLLATSMLSCVIVIYVVKNITGRIRPTLWPADWYWGSSFPSGHTLATAAFATALVLCISTIKPAWRNTALALAVLWVGLVAASRLLLGVHWPTDVLVAACIGAFLPLAISVVFESTKR